MSPKGTDEERNHIHALFERKLLISTWDCDDEDCISQQDVRNWIRGEFPHGAEILPFFACEPSRAIPTGGSSGKPKLVVQKVRPAYCEMDLSAWTAMTGQTPWSKQLIPGSLFHNLYSNATYIGLFFGQTVYLMERFDEGQALELIEKHGIQFIGLAPTMMDRMMRHPSFQTRNLESLEAVFHSGGPCPDKVKLAWIERIGARKVYEMYGETEMIASTFIRGEEWLEHRGSVGRPFGCELQIRDEEGRALPCGEVGEIFGKPAMGLSAKYVGPQSIKSEEDGFFSVGDLGWLDEEGFLYISDRRSDMIVTGGKNVYTAEVENAIFDYPGISDAVVIGIPDQQWGLSACDSRDRRRGKRVFDGWSQRIPPHQAERIQMPEDLRNRTGHASQRNGENPETRTDRATCVQLIRTRTRNESVRKRCKSRIAKTKEREFHYGRTRAEGDLGRKARRRGHHHAEPA